MTRTFGTLLENVVIESATHKLNLDDHRLTENTRASYNISEIANAKRQGAL